MDRLLLIDGNSIVYRAYYGSAFNGLLTNSKGFPVNAILTFNRMLTRTLDEYKPTHILIAFDAGKKTNRHDKLNSYKGGRSETPEELIKQFPAIKEMTQLMGINVHQIDGIEADDIIATLAKKHKDKMEVLIFSSDKDLYQLVDKGVSIISPQNGSIPNKIIRIEDFYETIGYNPSQVPDIKGIVGDPSDNLPGIKGIGIKGALKLIEEYKSLECIYDNIDKIKGAMQSKLINDEKIARLCKELAILEYDVEIPFTIEDLKYKWKVSKKLIEFYKKYELNSLVKRYEDEIQESYENILM